MKEEVMKATNNISYGKAVYLKKSNTQSILKNLYVWTKYQQKFGN